MPSSEPRRRLQKLFKRPEQSPTPSPTVSPSSPSVRNHVNSPPVSPSSPSVRKHVRHSSSHGSLKDLVLGVGRRSSVYASKASKRLSTENPFTTHAQEPRARPPSPGHVLPEVPGQTDLPSDFQNLSVSQDVRQQASDEDAADSINTRRQSRRLQVRKPLPDTPDQPQIDLNQNANTSGPTARYSSIPASHPEGRDDNNGVSQSDEAVLGRLHDIPAPLKFTKQGSNDITLTSPTLDPPSHNESGMVPSRKPVPQADSTGLDGRSQNTSRPAASNGNLDSSTDVSETSPSQGHDNIESAIGLERSYQIRDSKTPIDLKGVVDLENTEDTHLHERWAPAVTHETIVQNVHEIREERITREIHNHEVHHRVLPIVDIEVLPARHFVPVEGGYAEISAEDIPGRSGPNAQWMIAETVSKLTPKDQMSASPRQFTARKFEDGEGDYNESKAPEGHDRTESWWVHPPTLETRGRESGQTYPFHFGSANPADDGLRARLPDGQVIGSSPLLAEQQRSQRQVGKQAVSRERTVDTPPPVPPHKTMVSVLNRPRPISKYGIGDIDAAV